jgi:hypothetical protein
MDELMESATRIASQVVSSAAVRYNPKGAGERFARDASPDEPFAVDRQEGIPQSATMTGISSFLRAVADFRVS